MSSQFARELVVEQRRRLVGNLMAYAEKNVFPHLDAQQQQEFRSKVMQAVGSYHELVLDMLKVSVNDGTVVNDEALRLLRDLHARSRG